MVNVSEAGFWSSEAWEFSLAGLQRRAAKTEELAMIMTMINGDDKPDDDDNDDNAWESFVGRPSKTGCQN